MCGRMDASVGGWVCDWMDSCMDGGWMDGWMHAWMDRHNGYACVGVVFGPQLAIKPLVAKLSGHKQ